MISRKSTLLQKFQSAHDTPYSNQERAFLLTPDEMALLLYTNKNCFVFSSKDNDSEEFDAFLSALKKSSQNNVRFQYVFAHLDDEVEHWTAANVRIFNGEYQFYLLDPAKYQYGFFLQLNLIFKHFQNASVYLSTLKIQSDWISCGYFSALLTKKLKNIPDIEFEQLKDLPYQSFAGFISADGQSLDRKITSNPNSFSLDKLLKEHGTKIRWLWSSPGGYDNSVTLLQWGSLFKKKQYPFSPFQKTCFFRKNEQKPITLAQYEESERKTINDTRKKACSRVIKEITDGEFKEEKIITQTISQRAQYDCNRLLPIVHDNKEEKISTPVLDVLRSSVSDTEKEAFLTKHFLAASEQQLWQGISDILFLSEPASNRTTYSKYTPSTIFYKLDSLISAAANNPSLDENKKIMLPSISFAFNQMKIKQNNIGYHYPASMCGLLSVVAITCTVASLTLGTGGLACIFIGLADALTLATITSAVPSIWNSYHKARDTKKINEIKAQFELRGYNRSPR